MTKTFTEKGIEYLLLDVDNSLVERIFNSDRSEWKRMLAESGYWDLYMKEKTGKIIGLLKDITEEQAMEICPYPHKVPYGFILNSRKWFYSFLEDEHDRTIKEIAMLKQYENENWQAQFDYDYNYDDDSDYRF